MLSGQAVMNLKGSGLSNLFLITGESLVDYFISLLLFLYKFEVRPSKFGIRTTTHDARWWGLLGNLLP